MRFKCYWNRLFCFLNVQVVSVMNEYRPERLTYSCGLLCRHGRARLCALPVPVQRQ